MKRSFYCIHNDFIGQVRYYEDWLSVVDFLELCDDAALWIIDKDKKVIDWSFEEELCF